MANTKALTATQKKEKCAEYVELKTIENAVKLRINELKAQVDDIMHTDYLEEGIEKRVARVGGTIIGTITVVKDKAGYTVTDPDAFIEWLESYDLGYGAYRADVKQSREIYNMLLKHYSPEKIAHLFWVDPVPYKETEKRIINCDDVCLLEGLPEVIPGIEPKADKFKYIKVTDINLTTCVNALGANAEGVLKLLNEPKWEE